MMRPLKGNKGCKYHRTGTNVGEKNGNFKHGKHSRFLPQRLDEQVAALREARKSADYLSMEEQIDITELRIKELCEQLDTPASATTWREIKTARQDIIDAIRSGDDGKLNAALTVLADISAKGTKNHRAWDELFRVQRHYNALVQSERKRLIEDRFMLRVDEVFVMLKMISTSIQKHVSDVPTRLLLAKEITTLSQQAGYEISADIGNAGA